MKKIEFERSNQKLTELEINDFEVSNNIKLPKNLRNLLLQFNGGGLLGSPFEKDKIFINGEGSSNFSTLFSIKYGKNTMEFNIDVLQITEQHIPREEIPFADDSFGNVFTISTRKEDYGKIYFWALDVGEPRREFVADSLEEFFGVESFE